ncbi:MAG: hypothetical protein HYT93_04240 [Parcubacteria group bacterium]|nr:hypothetical protein [Parcubacteria group bacterium]
MKSLRFIFFAAFAFSLIFILTSQNSVNASLSSPVDSVYPEVKASPPTLKSWTIDKDVRRVYSPSADAFEAMIDVLEASGVIVGDGLHRPIQTLIVGTPHKPGTVAYFFISPIAFDGLFIWMLEEYEQREHGLHVRFWYFSDEIKSFEMNMYGDWSPTASEYFIPGTPDWSIAVEKSRLAWKLLCKKYSCNPHRNSAF